ncbi:MAG: class I tRNA ligase family protein [Candidatus Limnocylindrus sp.]
MFNPVDSKPDLISLEHQMLARWRADGTFARLRAQTTGGEPWSFLDGPITANNPMGVHHAWGRTYKDLFQRFRAALGHELRWQQGFDCQGLWVEVNVEKELGFTSKRQIEERGLAEFIRLCKQRVLTYAARQTEQSIRLGMWMDWNSPEDLLRLRDALANAPEREIEIVGAAGVVRATPEKLIGQLGSPEIGGSYFTFSDENNDLIWSFLAECNRRGWLYKGSDSMPWCTRCGTGISQHEMTEGYADRDDPSAYFGFPLVDRPGEELLAWTTTPWTIPANVAAAVSPTLTYELVEFDGRKLWIGATRRVAALGGGAPRAKVLESRLGSDLIGWRYRATFDAAPAVAEALGAGGAAHRVISWSDVGAEEGTSIVHIAPACGSEDHALCVTEGLPMIAPIDESGTYLPGFDELSGQDWLAVSDLVFAALERSGSLLRREKITHRYPHCWRCATPLAFRLVDEWFISMGATYEKPREQLSAEEKAASLRYQIMDVVDNISWLPAFGHDRELDWLRNMSDWMISKKRYWGLALPIYECGGCGSVEVLGSRDELERRAVSGLDAMKGHSPHRPYIDEVRIACAKCGEPVQRIPDVGNPWLDAGIVSLSTMRYRSDPEYWKRWFPADLITESFPGQFRNWFYSLLAMSTVMVGSEPTKTVFGYGLVFAEDGRQMHKSWGNSIEFDEAADRMGADVMRWLFAGSRPEENVHFGWSGADEARRKLLVLWNVYAFHIGYANGAGWRPGDTVRQVAERGAMDRWILSRTADLVATVEGALRVYDAQSAVARLEQGIDELSTWYLRRSRDRFDLSAKETDRNDAFATLHESLLTLLQAAAPIAPMLTDAMYTNLVADGVKGSIHLQRWPAARVAGWRDLALEDAMSRVIRAAELGRSVRSAAGIRTRQPLALARVVFAGDTPTAELLAILADELNVKRVEPASDASGLFERKVKVLLPKVGKRLGGKLQAVLAAARAGSVEFLPGGSVRIEGMEFAPDEIEIQAIPREGGFVAESEGLVVELETALTPELIAEGDLRELSRAVQDLRKRAGLQMGDPISLYLSDSARSLLPYKESLKQSVGARSVDFGTTFEGEADEIELSFGVTQFSFRRSPG